MAFGGRLKQTRLDASRLHQTCKFQNLRIKLKTPESTGLPSLKFWSKSCVQPKAIVRTMIDALHDALMILTSARNFLPKMYMGIVSKQIPKFTPPMDQNTVLAP